MMRNFKVHYLFVLLMILAPAAWAQDMAFDDFNRANGTNMGPDWDEQEGDTVIENNMGKGNSGAWMLGWMYHTSFEGNYADSTQSIEFFANMGSENVRLMSGLNPSTWGCVSVMIQDNDMDGLFDRVFFESAINAGNWGNLGVPVWYDLATPTLQGKMTLYFKDDGDTAVCEIYNATSGLTETFTASGILTFTYPIDGTNFGIGHYNFPHFDNWSAEIASASQPTLTLLDPGTSITDMSADCSVVVGSHSNGLFYWTQATGMVDIGGQGTAKCSDDGKVICGNIVDGGYDQAALWLGGTSWQPLGGIGGTSGSSMSTAYDISGDGTKVVGLGWVSAGTAHAFQWDAVSGMVDLGSLGGKDSRANSISSDGHVIVGWDADPSTGWWRGAKWVDGVEELLDPGSPYLGDAYGVSSDGSWIVGDNHPTFIDDGWRWSQGTGFVPTGTLSGWLFQGHNMDVSDDGKLVAGWSGYFMDQFATIWNEHTGLLDLTQYLRDNGVSFPTDLFLTVAVVCSNDGTVIAGRAQDSTWTQYGFIATIPPMVAPLEASAAELSASTGGTVDFALDAGADNAGRDYVLLGSVSGTEPGILLPGGQATLPLNWDFFTNIVWTFVNTPVFADFLGTLDAEGAASAQLNASPMSQASVGVVMYYAYCLGGPFDYASNPVSLEIVP